MSKVTMPEPVAEVCSDHALHWAGSGPIAPLCERTGAKVGSLLITTTQAEAYANAGVREVLEQAAAIADHQHFGGANDDDLSWTDCAATIAVSIRALIAKVEGKS